MQYTKTDVIAWLCHSLIHRHIDFRCGVKVPTRGGTLRADVAIIRNGKPAILIEVKKRNSRKMYQKQVLAYEQTGIPFTYCMGMTNIEATVSGIEEFIREPGFKV